MLRHANILVLGAGGFTLSAENKYENTFTYVDIDSRLKEIVLANFLAQLNGGLIIDDARHYVRATKQKYNAIIVDVYSNLHSIPAYLLTYQFMQDIKKITRPNGVVILNVIAKPTLSDAYSKRIDNTIRMVFKNCMIQPARYSDQVTNILYVCSNTANEIDATIYTDNLNTSTTDAFKQ